MKARSDYFYISKKNRFFWNLVANHRTHKNLPITFEGHEYIRQIAQDASPDKIIQKSTQGGVSEILICFAITEAEEKRSVFYVLPTYDLLHRFIRNRWEKTVAFSPYYNVIAGAENKGTKTFKNVRDGVISFAGSNTPVPFTEFPADTYIVDELDQCNLDHIKMGQERLGHSTKPKTFYVSNPTLPSYGINTKYKQSDQKVWVIPCPHCGEWVHPDFFDHVVMQENEDVWVLRDTDWEPGIGRDIQLVCHSCGGFLDRFAKGEHLSRTSGRFPGYHISRLFSGTVSIESIVNDFNEGLGNDWAMQRFYNSDLGLPYVAQGAKVTKELLDQALSNFTIPAKAHHPTVAGIDVGKVFHIRINEILPSGYERAVFIGERRELKELLDLIREYGTKVAVIDALPETRISKQFASALPGGFRCFFGSERKDFVSPKDKTVTVDRTQTLDEVKEAYVLNRILLPASAPSILGFYEQMQASTRIWEEKREKYTWEEGDQDDHYFLAEGYLRVAKKILSSYGGAL